MLLIWTETEKSHAQYFGRRNQEQWDVSVRLHAIRLQPFFKANCELSSRDTLLHMITPAKTLQMAFLSFCPDSKFELVRITDIKNLIANCTGWNATTIIWLLLVFLLFSSEMTFYRTAWQPYRLRHTHVHRVNQTQFYGDEYLEVW